MPPTVSSRSPNHHDPKPLPRPLAREANHLGSDRDAREADPAAYPALTRDLLRRRSGHPTRRRRTAAIGVKQPHSAGSRRATQTCLRSRTIVSSATPPALLSADTRTIACSRPSFTVGREAIMRALVPPGRALCFVLAAVELDGRRGGRARRGAAVYRFCEDARRRALTGVLLSWCAGKTGRLICQPDRSEGPLARSHTDLVVRSRGRRECVAASCVRRRADGWWRREVFGSDRDEAEGRP